VLVPLLIAVTVAYWVSDTPLLRKVMPLALNLFALSMIVFGNWWSLVLHSGGRGRAPAGMLAMRARLDADRGPDTSTSQMGLSRRRW
jgi:hypothetical protein